MPEQADNRFEEATAIFVVADIERSLDFYHRILGFEIAFRYGEPVFYAGICRGAVSLHLQAAHMTTRIPGQAGVNICISDVDTYHAAIQAQGVAIGSALADRPYGMRDFSLQDSDGNFLCFGTPLETGDA